jgi:putative Ca2+/H+ antiporter (TMEM165/GDT1 family)
MKIQKNTLYKGRNTELCTVLAVMKGNNINTKIPPNSANTPASLLGIARKIA